MAELTVFRITTFCLHTYCGMFPISSIIMVIIQHWLINLLFYSAVSPRQFYRSRGLKAFGGRFIKNVTNVRRSEYCLHECFMTAACKSFNTFETGENSHTCQLLSSGLCDLHIYNGIKKNPIGSVYFSKKSDECVIFVKNHFCIKYTSYVRYTTLANCTIFTFHDEKLFSGNSCMHRIPNKKGKFITTNDLGLCGRFELIGDNLREIGAGDNFIGKSPRWFGIYESRDSSRRVKAVKGIHVNLLK